MSYKIVKSSNFDLENYTEEFVTGLPQLNTKLYAEILAHVINSVLYRPDEHPDHYKVVDSTYVLKTFNPF